MKTAKINIHEAKTHLSRLVEDVASGSEAERAGLMLGDVIRNIDGERPRSLADARTRLSGRERSDVVLELSRAGAPLKLRVTREPVRN